jgi:hypothetical protein
MRPQPGTIDPESPYALYECQQCGKRAHTQKANKPPVGFYLSCECPIARPWKHILTPGWQRMMTKLYALRDAGIIWKTLAEDCPRDECGTPLLDSYEVPA